MGSFRTELGAGTFQRKYAHEQCETWPALADTLVEDVCRTMLSTSLKAEIKEAIRNFEFIPGGRYLRNAGRPLKYFSNCFSLRALEDTREDWADLSWRVESCLLSGGGIGVDYSIYRARNSPLKRTGGIASGPVSAMLKVNEIGRQAVQGGDRRSAIYGSLKWNHGDSGLLLRAKNWDEMPIPGTDKSFADAKAADFNFPAPLDHTNISLNYDDEWLALNDRASHQTFVANVRQAMRNGEPGFSFNFGDKSLETLRNACVPGDVRVLTRDGYREIQALVGKSVPVWNGLVWSVVEPRSTGFKDILLVRLSDGTELRCSPNHEFVTVLEGRDLTRVARVEADFLLPGMRLAKFEMPVVETGDDSGLPDAYSHGFYCGDGTEGLTISYVHFPKAPVEPRLVGVVKDGARPDKFRVWHHEAMSKTAVPLNATTAYRLRWLAGLLDGDGTVTRDKHGNGFQLASVNRTFLQDVRLMLTTLGVRAKICSGNPAGYRMMPDGRGGQAAYWCQDTFRLLIGDVDTYNLLKMGLDCLRCKADIEAVPQRDARRFVRVVEVIETGDVEETFCFNEPNLHLGTFEGIVTGQCTEFTSEDDSDSCNLGSVNFAAIESLSRLYEVSSLAALFLICGTVTGMAPYQKVLDVRAQNRRIGVGLMGVHEWLLKRGYRYEVVPELHDWLQVWKDASDLAAQNLADRLSLARPKGVRSIAPTGTIGIIAGTTTGIEPIFAVAYKRRYLKNGTEWCFQYVVDSMAQSLIDQGIPPSSIESAADLAVDIERRIKFQADVQDYVDMAISSTINLPPWGSELNCEDRVAEVAGLISKYAPRLRGLTCYPDGSRGGQPITSMPYSEAIRSTQGVEYREHDSCKGGVCGV